MIQTSIVKGELFQEIVMKEHRLNLHSFSFDGRHCKLDMIVDIPREYIGYEVVITIPKEKDETIIPFGEYSDEEHHIDFSIALKEAINCYAKLYKQEYNRYINNEWKAVREFHEFDNAN